MSHEQRMGSFWNEKTGRRKDLGLDFVQVRGG